VHPALLVQPSYASWQSEHVTIVPALHAHDPLLHHMVLALQAAIEGEGAAGKLYVAVLADALVVHFLRRYATSQSALGQASGGLAPSKLKSLHRALSETRLDDSPNLQKHHTEVGLAHDFNICRTNVTDSRDPRLYYLIYT
jgi:hypothetical protein